MLPNIQHSDKWRVLFSNIPGFVPGNYNNFINFDLYETYIKSVSFPSLDVEFVESEFLNYHINHPISKINNSLNDISITFKLSEDMLNYHYIYNWMTKLRNQNNVDAKKFFRANFIDEFTIIFLDNEKRPKIKYVYKNCFISSLGSLSLTQGTSDELTFDINLKYEDYEVKIDTSCQLN